MLFKLGISSIKYIYIYSFTHTIKKNTPLTTSFILVHSSRVYIYAKNFSIRILCIRKLTRISLTLQVKQGAENMIQSLTSSGHRDKKLLQEAQQMLDDSRAKIEFLRMRIMKLNQAREQQHARDSGPAPNGDSTGHKGKSIWYVDFLVARAFWLWTLIKQWVLFLVQIFLCCGFYDCCIVIFIINHGNCFKLWRYHNVTKNYCDF